MTTSSARAERKRERRRGWGRESERRVPEGVRGVVQTRRGSGVKQEVARACPRAATTRPPAYWQEVEDGGGDCWAGPAVLGHQVGPGKRQVGLLLFFLIFLFCFIFFNFVFATVLNLK